MYQVRRITCPLCGHRFTEFLANGIYEVKGHDGYWEKLKCTMCENDVLVNEDEDYALIADEADMKIARIVLS